MQQADERIEKYMTELEKNDASERRPETLSTKEIRHVLEYLRGRKQQLSRCVKPSLKKVLQAALCD